MKKLILISYFVTCILGKASLLCAQSPADPVAKIRTAFTLVQQLQIQASQAAMIIEIQNQLAGAVKDIETPRPTPAPIEQLDKKE